MKILVIGSNGQLGTDISYQAKNLGYDVVDLDHSSIEIKQLESALQKIEEISPDVIINTAAMHNVEKCEENPSLAFQVNGIGSKNLAIISNKLDVLLIHISTDYVFSGSKGKPYTETDLTGPLNTYAITKLAGEHYIQATAKKYFILRTSGLYGSSPCRAKGGLNFVELMLKLAKERDEIRVVDDEILTPTSTKELANQVIKMIDCSKYGIYHATAEGSCSWYAFAKKIFEIAYVKTNLQIAGPNEFPMKVLRPKYSVLENANLKRENINLLGNWEDGLKNYLISRRD